VVSRGLSIARPEIFLAAVFVCAATGAGVRAARPTDKELESAFLQTVRPFVEMHCAACHDAEEPEGDLNLTAFGTIADVIDGHERWELVLERLEAGEMPPDEAELQPSPAARQAVVDWIRAVRTSVAERNAGDPGTVLARRLSNAEYDYTICDLTGVDIRPTREFPVDPANEAGFDNSGESLAMSPALLKKYLDAARHVADHLVLKPSGLAFAPHPVVTDTDRDKYCVLRIVDFYQRQPTNLTDYFMAAWRYKHRAVLGRPAASLAEVAAEANVSAKYLATIWPVLDEEPTDVGPLAKLQAMWKQLPPPDSHNANVARRGCHKMRTWIIELREKLQPEFDNLQHEEVAEGSQPFILWKNTQYATHRRAFDPGVLEVEGRPSPRWVAEEKKRAKEQRKKKEDDEDDEDDDDDERPRRHRPDPELFVPADEHERARYEASLTRFCDVFPNAFFVSERGRAHMDRRKQKQDKGRLLTAGFHNAHGYFRDDQPLCELILDEGGRRELDELWRELDFITLSPQRQHADFIFYERAESKTIKGPEFDFIRSEDKDASSEAKIKRLADVYLAMARESLRQDGGDAECISALEEFFHDVNANIRAVEQARLAAEPKHLEDLTAFAERAYRRLLSSAERDELFGYYRTLREEDGLDHETAIRECVVSLLMSPHFCYRIDALESDRGDGQQPLSDYALASRLSYFLWSSLPDDELLARAAAGDLHQPQVLAAQAQRMLREEKVRRLAVEFGGNWLDIRRFEEHNAVDRERFPSFDNELRQAMFEEPVRFFIDVAQNDRSVLDFLYGKHTFVNALLARHYGMTDVDVPDGEWVRIDDVQRYHRGGLLPMAAFLTKNAPGLRTSPVKRGYWVVRRVLGEVIPSPPAEVPELPHDEAQLGELTLREVLARHRADKSCAACHARFDSLGLVFEGYGPIGERRIVDLGGRPVDARAAFPDGSDGAGVVGLQTYIRERRQDDFLENLCRKMLAYALGRTLILSDEPLVEEMCAKLKSNDYRFGSIVETIVTSPQFLTKRGGTSLVP